MARLLSCFKVLTLVTLIMFMFFQTGVSRGLIAKSSKGVDHFATTAASHSFQKSREAMVLDYEDAKPNTNDKSGLTQPLPSDQEPPEPRD